MKKRKSTARAVLSNIHALRERRFSGNALSIDTLLDFDEAVKQAKLTARQSEALRLVFELDLTQKEAAAIMGVSQPAVAIFIREATSAIDEIYEYWAWRSGELSAADFAE